MKRWIVWLVVVLVICLPQKTSAQDPTEVRVWWPGSLQPEDPTVIDNVLNEFGRTAQLERRIYTTENIRLVEQLRLTQQVARSAMPDIILLQRSDLVDAVKAGFLSPIVSANLINQLPTNLLELGQVDGELYGWPYMLNVQHVVYNPNVIKIPPANFNLILENNIPLTFPGQPSENGQVVNDFVLLAYWSTGGRFVDDEGQPTLDIEALNTVLEFFALGSETDVFGINLLTYTSPHDYWEDIVNQDIEFAIIDTNIYLNPPIPPSESLSVIGLPTHDGNSIVMLDGWVWALVAGEDPDQQAQAIRLLNWMMGADNQNIVARTLHMLPSRKSALDEDNPYLDTIGDLMTDAVFIDEQRRNQAAVALQEAFEKVITGTQPENAAADALASLADN